MRKFNIFFTLVCSIILASCGPSQGRINNNLPIKFRVYEHEYFSGPNLTSFEVARAAITATSPTGFGSVRVGEVLMTSGPDQTTGKLGRIEGLVAFTGRTEASGVLHLVFLFTEGKYNGSSISLLGRRTVSSPNDEVPVVGGTGKFRMARGYTITSLYSYDPTTDYAVYVYDFYVYPN